MNPRTFPTVVAGDRVPPTLCSKALDIVRPPGCPTPLRNPRFVVDVNLGQLARLLRLLGFDGGRVPPMIAGRYQPGRQRILLTRDRSLLKAPGNHHGLFVHSQHPEEQALSAAA